MIPNMHSLHPADLPPSSGSHFSPQILNVTLSTIPLLINTSNDIPQQCGVTSGPNSQSLRNAQQTPEGTAPLYPNPQDITQPKSYSKPEKIPSQHSIMSRGRTSNISAQARPVPIDPAIVSISQSGVASSTHPRGSAELSPGSNSSKSGFSGSTASSFIPLSLLKPSVDGASEVCEDYDNICSEPEWQVIDHSSSLGSDLRQVAQAVDKEPRSRGEEIPLPASQQFRDPRSSNKSSCTWSTGNFTDTTRECDYQQRPPSTEVKKAFTEAKKLDFAGRHRLHIDANQKPGYNITHISPQGYGLLNKRLDTFKRHKYYEEELDEENDTPDESDLDAWDDKTDSTVVIRTLTGIICPFVTRAQMNEIEKIAINETGPSEEQIIENAGRSAAGMCLKALGGPRRIQPNNHNDAPLVIVLAGNTKTGVYGLCAARHLANHGCEVIVCVTGKEKEVLKGIAVQSKYLKATGSIVIRSAAELPEPYTTPVDLIVDALLGYQPSTRDLDLDNDLAFIGDLIDWANDNKAPILSLDMPSGFKGQPSSGNIIHPKWTLCLGAPRSGLRDRSMTGEIFLADIGIPHILYKMAGVHGWQMPWGAEYLVGLEYS
ncbi:YjeF N-terminal domain-like protein [Basidiobolus meristosporus CBS 931.73]|uniref:YjeF N-terminal domain-like protein n=1 Tax=Basidiobolus meristosporus CBS 931.73 TaxID=1314790 RepID=A0A1Y1Z3S6_9FUNG|nr:YjeF N-terminal domain-like protein [Basidiobolus meristosporus CBS 931.73]|eukprot:ORY04899.1 YjeF N-terminal domain-like protein [Basidiobolus meristosporus CBS 931.73]